MTGDKVPLIIILGPTAIGKTGLSIELAESLGGEIIGADSRQIYRYMDIGTAKPSAKQQKVVKHHLIDVVDPDETLTLASYQKHVYATVDNIVSRGKIPLLVGGTGQYITAVEEGWSIPHVAPNEELRIGLETEAEAIGNIAFHEKLALVDPVAAERIHPNNVRRVVRALEVYIETGTPISILQQKRPPPYRIRSIGLRLDRETLYEKADKRVLEMVNEGFVEEVQKLLELGYSAQLPSMSALGYREMSSLVRGEITLEDAIQQTQSSTHNFIRRQEIWFRGHDNGILWHNINEISSKQMSDNLRAWSEMC